jgi:hypothetical protein
LAHASSAACSRELAAVHAQIAHRARRTLGHQDVDQLARPQARVKHPACIMSSSNIANPSVRVLKML